MAGWQNAAVEQLFISVDGPTWRERQPLLSFPAHSIFQHSEALCVALCSSTKARLGHVEHVVGILPEQAVQTVVNWRRWVSPKEERFGGSHITTPLQCAVIADNLAADYCYKILVIITY